MGAYKCPENICSMNRIKSGQIWLWSKEVCQLLLPFNLWQQFASARFRLVLLLFLFRLARLNAVFIQRSLFRLVSCFFLDWFYTFLNITDLFVNAWFLLYLFRFGSPVSVCDVCEAGIGLCLLHHGVQGLLGFTRADAGARMHQRLTGQQTRAHSVNIQSTRIS